MSRCFLITGTSSGIGNALSKHLLSHGHKVIGLSRREPSKTAENFTHYQVDLSDLKKLPGKLKEIEKKHPEIDFIILNAGSGHLCNIEELSYEEIEKLVDFNLTHYAFITKAFLPLLKKKEHANLVYVSSTSGHKGSKRFTIYAASKFGVRGLAESVRDECRNTGVHVTIMSPGMVRTEFFDKFELGPSDHAYEAIEPEDISHMIDMLMHLRPGTNVEEIVVRPMRAGIKKEKQN